MLSMRTATIVVMIGAALAGSAGADQDRARAGYPFVFREVSHEVGLYPAIAGVRAHAGLLGDFTGNGYLDFFVGAFETEDSSPSVLFRNIDGTRFEPVTDQPGLYTPGRTSGGMFADLNNNGRLDLYIGNHTSGGGSGDGSTGNRLFRNDGDGRFTDVTADSGAAPPYGTRNVVPIDVDGSGLLDILLGGGRYRNQGRPGARLLRNVGELKFEDASERLPEGMGAMTVAIGDFNNDTYPDIFFVHRNGGLLLNDGQGNFAPASAANEIFAAAFANPPGQSPAGVAIADINRDGLLDVVIGQNTKTPWTAPVAPRVLLNRGPDASGQLIFEDVTEAAGIAAVPLKTPHLEIRDFDNDGWPDIYVCTFKFAGGQVYPIIFRNLGVDETGMVRFQPTGLDVNDFPTEEDSQMRGSTGRFFAKMNEERKITYAVAAPAGDFNNDGRIDIFAAEWWAENPSFLLRNETPGGNWIIVRVDGAEGVNRMGIGSKVRIYQPGRLGQADALIGCQDINIGYGFSTSHEAVAHFGLGDLTECDVEVILPFNRGVIRRERVTANQRLTVP